MKRGKHICKELKAVRRKIAEENGIPLEIKECTYNGPCKGTCPRCEAEVRFLENELAKRIRLGKVATVAGLALGLASCGGQPQGTDTLLRQPKADTSHSLGEEQGTGVQEGPSEVIEVPDVGEIELVGVMEELPPPQIDSDFILGMAVEPVEVIEGEEELSSVFTVVDEDPEFPGGKDAMTKFIQDSLRYPQMALANNIQGKVYVTFVVEADGSITNPRILRDIGGGCGKEAIRVVKMMPKWEPGKKDGKPVRVQFNLPVNFVITEDMKVSVIEGMAPIEVVHPLMDDSVEDMKGPNAPTQQMKVDGVKVIVR